MKNYRTLNGLKSDANTLLSRAYDKGYAQGKEDYQREYAEWLPLPLTNNPRPPHKKWLLFQCSACKSATISSAYLFCPYCGADHRGGDN